MTVTWYADNSELGGIKNAEIADILIFGGIILGSEVAQQLQGEVEDIKERHVGHRRAPIKWNMKDLRDLYKAQQQVALYERLMETTREWRRDIFSTLAKYECALLVACIEGYSAKRTVLKERKDELSRYVFANGLMRFGLHVRDVEAESAVVVMDWPDKGAPRPFDSEYAHAYMKGQTADGRVRYGCGRLEALGFVDSVMYTNAHHSTLLQIADLVVGATREFLECCLEKKPGGQGLDCLKTARARFRGAPDRIVGRGIVVPSGNNDLLARAQRGVKELLYGT